jgi:hypothetical protein
VVRVRRAVLIALLALLLVSGPQPATTVPIEEAGVSVRLVPLEPGAVVDEGPPRGWTHRIIRSIPRLATGDLASLPASASATATLFRTIIAAQVVEQGGAYRLARIGVGNAVPVRGREVIVTPDGPPEALATLGLVERIVLQEAERKLAEGRLACATATFALYRTPTVLRAGERHVDAVLNYALLVEPRSGALTTLVWAGGRPREIVALPANLTFDAALDVRASRKVGPLPVAWSFALDALPPGRTIAVPPALAEALSDTASPAEIERALRGLLRDAVARGRSARRSSRRAPAVEMPGGPLRAARRCPSRGRRARGAARGSGPARSG